MLLQLKKAEKTLENALVEVKNEESNSIDSNIQESFQYVVDFLFENIVEFKYGEKSEDGSEKFYNEVDLSEKENNMYIKIELQEEYPEATRYLEEDFLENLGKIASELNKSEPEIETLFRAGTEVLQRLKSFSKVSTPRTF